MEKPGIEPATPGLQGIALIHYTTGASLLVFTLACKELKQVNTSVFNILSHIGNLKGTATLMRNMFYQKELY